MGNKVGRPTTPREHARAPGISVRLTQAERVVIDAAIKQSGLGRSAWARKCLLYVAQNGIRIT